MHIHTHTIRTAALMQEHPYEVAFRRAVFGMIVVAFLAYASLISTSVFNVIARKQAVSDTVATSARIADLEQEYFSLTSAILPGRGADFGLMPVEEKHFVTRTPGLGFSGMIYLPRDNEN